MSKNIRYVDIWELERDFTHPGIFLKREFLDEMKLSQVQFAKYIGVSCRTINELVNAKRGINAEMALRLSKAFRTTPNFWLNMQSNYDLLLLKGSMKNKLSFKPLIGASAESL